MIMTHSFCISDNKVGMIMMIVMMLTNLTRGNKDVGNDVDDLVWLNMLVRVEKYLQKEKRRRSHKFRTKLELN